jgi:hypothetical protein
MIDKGWECPRCEAIMSPSSSICINCKGNKLTSDINQVMYSNSPPTNDMRIDLQPGAKHMFGLYSSPQPTIGFFESLYWSLKEH